jgi:hypothetical protein
VWSYGKSFMPQPANPNAPRLSTEGAFLELLIDTLETLERPARGQFLQRFFRPIAHVDLTETQCLDFWDQALARRRWERISLADTSAYALIGEAVEHTARVIDLGYGGVAFETPRPEELQDAFYAVLHMPILPPMRVNLRRFYQEQGSRGTSRVGCSYVP